MQNLSIIGAGRLGTSLGRLSFLSGLVQIGSVCNRNMQHARDAVAFIGAGSAHVPGDLPPLSGLILLAVPDDAIAVSAAQLVGFVEPGAVVCHASGVHDHSVLAPLARAGVATGSLHPAFSFADPARAVASFAGTLCALEGEAAALPVLSTFAAAIGGRPFALAPGGKAAYHAALSIASNYLVTLTAEALAAAARAGIDATLARELLGSLMRQTLDNALALGPAAALTGPIARGDAATVARHLAVLDDAAAQACYRALGRATLDLARPKLSAGTIAALTALLAD
jgi:predicted short-subunit dehydrogenase-like oxidoreductase (DUF2520 family)